MELKQDSDLSAIIKMLPVFGKYSNLAFAYVELFGIAPMSKHTAKVRSILDVLRMVFQAEALTFNKTRYSISHAGIAEALNIVVLKNFSERLENHNYLKKVMMGISEKEGRESGKLKERDLRQREERLMAGYARAAEQVETPTMKTVPPACLTEEQVAANRRRLKAMIQQIGG